MHSKKIKYISLASPPSYLQQSSGFVVWINTITIFTFPWIAIIRIYFFTTAIASIKAVFFSVQVSIAVAITKIYIVGRAIDWLEIWINTITSTIPQYAFDIFFETITPIIAYFFIIVVSITFSIINIQNISRTSVGQTSYDFKDCL